MRLLPALVVVGLISASSSALADIRPPNFEETCTIQRVQQAGEICTTCGASYQDPSMCAVRFGTESPWAHRCRTAGASTWTEVWCAPEGNAPPPPLPRLGAPGEGSANVPAAQPVPAAPGSGSGPPPTAPEVPAAGSSAPAAPAAEASTSALLHGGAAAREFAAAPVPEPAPEPAPASRGCSATPAATSPSAAALALGALGLLAVRRRRQSGR